MTKLPDGIKALITLFMGYGVFVAAFVLPIVVMGAIAVPLGGRGLADWPGAIRHLLLGLVQGIGVYALWEGRGRWRVPLVLAGVVAAVAWWYLLIQSGTLSED